MTQVEHYTKRSVLDPDLCAFEIDFEYCVNMWRNYYSIDPPTETIRIYMRLAVNTNNNRFMSRVMDVAEIPSGDLSLKERMSLFQLLRD